MRHYLPLTKAAFLEWSSYRLAFFFTVVGNLLYIVLIYFLWGSIYANRPSLNGMSFEQVFIYLTLANSLFILFKTYTDWDISQQIIKGDIVVPLIRPLDYQLAMFFGHLGGMLANLVFVTVPSVVVLALAFDAPLLSGSQLLLLPIALIQAYLISFMIDYCVGLSSFYTESLWGIM